MGSSIKLFNADCINTMKDLRDSTVELIVTDPPYNLGNFMKERATNLKRMRPNSFYSAGWDNLDYQDWLLNMDKFFEHSARVMKKGGSMVVFMSLIKAESVIKMAQSHGFYYKTTGVWHKTNPMPRNMNLHFINSIEGWIYFTYQTHTGVFNNESRVMHDFVESSVTPKNEKKYGTHPTQKPEKIIQHFVELLSQSDATVLDPFMGSGTTGVVSRRLNRNFIGIELNRAYFDIALKRISDVSAEEECVLKVVHG